MLSSVQGLLTKQKAENSKSYLGAGQVRGLLTPPGGLIYTMASAATSEVKTSSSESPS